MNKKYMIYAYVDGGCVTAFEVEANNRAYAHKVASAILDKIILAPSYSLKIEGVEA